MKTINLKNALKFNIFLLILVSTNVFSFPKLPSDSSSSESVTRLGPISKVTTSPRTSATSYSTVYKSNAVQSKNNKRFKK